MPVARPHRFAVSGGLARPLTERAFFRRTVGVVLLPDGRSLNHELVRAGLAWMYRRYTNDQSLSDLEEEAQGARRGLWADPHACAAVGMANHEEAVSVSQGNATNYPPPQAVANADAAGAG